jgi:preprotein translocase subunit SecA
LFEQMLGKFKTEMVTILSRVRIRSEDEVARLEQEQQQRQQRAAMEFQHADAGNLGVEEEAAQVQAALAADGSPAVAAHAPVLRDAPKVGRNDPCPCGSGKKYKQCHGRLA